MISFFRNIEFIPPYQVDRKPNELHYTYLDTIGRPVIVINLKNSAENHIKDFQLKYKFQKIMILQEPLLAVAFFFVLFMVVILFVRIDFSIKTQTSVRWNFKWFSIWFKTYCFLFFKRNMLRKSKQIWVKTISETLNQFRFEQFNT